MAVSLVQVTQTKFFCADPLLTFKLTSHSENGKTSDFTLIKIQTSVIICDLISEAILSVTVTNKTLQINVYKTMVLPTVLYLCEAWSLNVGQQQRL
jgi:hypothetical protein